MWSWWAAPCTRVPLTTLTVNFPGIASLDKATLSVGGVKAQEKSYPDHQAVFTVFRGLTYDILLVEGGMRHEGSVLCDDPEEIYDAPLT